MVTANEVKFIEQQKIAVRHATINIIRAIVLMKRADNTLNFADNSLEGTDELLIIQDIGMARDGIEDVVKRLDKYIYK